MPVKHKLGRPLKFTSAKQLERKVHEYFNSCDTSEKKYTITGLAISLGLTRKQLIEYQERETFKNVINGAKAIIEAQVEEILLSGKAQAGSIFWLKNQGWSDKQEIEVNDITKLSKDELIDKIKSLSTIVPVRAKQAAQSAKTGTDN